MIKHIFFGLFVLLVSYTYAQEVSLSVEIEGIKSEKGKILYSLFSDKNGFPGDMTKAFKKGIVHIVDGRAIIDLDLPPGTYAIMVFHDEDDNNELKTNWFGMPKEGVGNSNNHKGIPSYKKSVFKLYKNKTITIALWYA